MKIECTVEELKKMLEKEPPVGSTTEEIINNINDLAIKNILKKDEKVRIKEVTPVAEPTKISIMLGNEKVAETICQDLANRGKPQVN